MFSLVPLKDHQDWLLHKNITKLCYKLDGSTLNKLICHWQSKNVRW